LLFNSYIFIFCFLPLVLLGFFICQKLKYQYLSLLWLISSSLFFYAWWNTKYLLLIIFSVLINFALGSLIEKIRRKSLLVFGLFFNLGLIGYYKYANFFVDNLNTILASNIHLHKVILPLAISFFTFQQIVYLVDAYRGQTKQYKFLHYCLFVTFFPQLIAGPIVHHKEMIPQFNLGKFYNLRFKNLAIGLSIFAIGLFKKIVIADGISIYATPMFDAAEINVQLTFFEAWFGTLAYSMQLYFDFSGYSDMAIGLARMFGLKLPVNFYSPYKALNIADFWRRWHITLSRLIREYLWDPVSLNLTRLGFKYKLGTVTFFVLATIIPTLFTFFWIGLWHGAGWDFIIFGLLHGSYIVLFNIWSKIKQNFPKIKFIRNRYISTSIAWSITFLSVAIGWVFFRAESINGAKNVLSAMFGYNQISLPPGLLGNLGSFEKVLVENGFVFQGMFSNGVLGNDPFIAIQLVFLLIGSCLVLPNCQQIFARYKPYISTYPNVKISYPRWLLWRPTLKWGFLSVVFFSLAILSINKESEFLYFQF